MAAGDVVAGTQSIAASGTYDIKPSAGVEWVIHNVYGSAGYKISMTDGTNTIDVDTLTGADSRLGLTTHVTNTYWMKITNTSASVAVLIAYDGVQTK